MMLFGRIVVWALRRVEQEFKPRCLFRNDLKPLVKAIDGRALFNFALAQISFRLHDE
jgi:hypothetical protein